MQQAILSGKIYNLQVITGTILSSIKYPETKISGGGGALSGSGGGYTTSTTIIHDQFFLLDQKGNEHSFQLSDFNLAVRESNTVSVVAAVRENKASGPYVAVINHSTDKYYLSNQALKNVCGPSKILLTGLFVIVSVLGFLLFGERFIVGMFILLFGTLGYAIFRHFQDVKVIEAEINTMNFR
jgi:hypothetical protein